MVDAKHIATAVRLAQQHGVTRLILFGSALNSPESAHDLDLACDGLTGWDFFTFSAEIEEALDIPVDMVPLSPASPFTAKIEREGVVIL
jgi:predicted nucleotidyltransferase